MTVGKTINVLLRRMATVHILTSTRIRCTAAGRSLNARSTNVNYNHANCHGHAKGHAHLAGVGYRPGRVWPAIGQHGL
jgi:hypothetical protein